jgi:hypothetical protein
MAVDTEKDNKVNVEVVGNALENENKKVEKDEGEDKKGFFKTVGDAFKNVAEGAEKKLETIYDDKEKRALFLGGLNTIIEASSFKPISQATSPIGMVAKGTKKGILESEAIETKRKEIEAKKSKAASDSILSTLKYKLDVEDMKNKKFEPLYKRLFKKYENLEKADNNDNIFNKIITITAKEIIESGQIPTGLIYSRFPKAIQAFSDILPESLKPNNEFFNKIQDEASFLSQISKLTDSLVLGDIGQLVPVSDKDVEIKRATFANAKDTPQAFLLAVIQQDALNKASKYKSNYLTDFQIGDGLQKGLNFESDFASRGADFILADLSTQHDQKTLFEEAAKLGYTPDYTQYQDGTKNFSPYALLEASASLKLGGYDKWSKTTGSTSLQSGNTDASVTVSPNLQTNENQIDKALEDEIKSMPDIVK